MVGVGLMPPRATHFLVFSAFILSCSSFAFSRPLDQQSGKTSVFNLSASIQRSNEILSSNPETIARQQSDQPQKHSTKSSSSLSLKLYSRDALRSPPFKSYGELILSRAQREKARLNFIYNKLNGNSSSSSDSSFTPVDLQAPLYSGVPSLHLGEYVAQLGFGTPSQQVYAVIDTGSDITWVPCSGSIFDPSASQSYKVLTCDAPSCQELAQTSDGSCIIDQNSCQYSVDYVDGSSTTGDFATDTLQFGDTAIPDSPFGCDARTPDSYGLLGLGRGPLSFPSLQQASSFSYCLLDRDSTAPSTIEVGSVDIPSGAVTAQLLKSGRRSSSYYVGLTGISVGGARLQIPASAFDIDQSTGGGGVIIDSGATVTYFIPEVYGPLRDAFAESVTQADRVDGSGLCYRLTSDLYLPLIEFHFGEQTLTLSVDTYFRNNGGGVYCFTFELQRTGNDFSIIGNTHQQELLVTYDLGGSMIGFTKNPNCQG